MKSQPINRFEGVKLELSIDEALRFVKGEKQTLDRILDHISSHLSAAGIPFSEVGNPPSKKPDVKCEICGGMFFARGLKIHQRKAHPETFAEEKTK